MISSFEQDWDQLSIDTILIVGSLQVIGKRSSVSAVHARAVIDRNPENIVISKRSRATRPFVVRYLRDTQRLALHFRLIKIMFLIICRFLIHNLHVIYSASFTFRSEMSNHASFVFPFSPPRYTFYINRNIFNTLSSEINQA